MKKLTALISAALCVTIGGVYATFSYIEGDIPEQTTAAVSLSIETAENAARGGITVNSHALTLGVHEDDSNDVANDALLEGSGSFVVTYKASDGNPVTLEYVITIDEGNTYEFGGQTLNIFTVTSDAISLGEFSGTEQTSVTVQVADMLTAGYIAFVDSDLILETYDEYTALKSGLETTKITITVREAE